MPDIDRILTAYEKRICRAADELIADLDPGAEERLHLALVAQLLQGVIRSYGDFHGERNTGLDASTSVMYAAAGSESRQVLNVPLRSLVDAGTLTAWQGRFVNSHLALQHTVLVSGPPDSGKSTLLNALVNLLPREARLGAILDQAETLPVLRERVLALAATAPPGTPARDAALAKTAGTELDWIVVGELAVGDAPAFVNALAGGCAGLATMVSEEPEATLNDWLDQGPELRPLLGRLRPLVLHLRRDRGGRPRVVEVSEVAVQEGALVLTPHQPG